jgi:hypothetical protein
MLSIVGSGKRPLTTERTNLDHQKRLFRDTLILHNKKEPPKSGVGLFQFILY